LSPAHQTIPNAKDEKEMSKKDLIDAVAQNAELTKEKAGVAVDAVLEHIRSSMRKGEEVRIPDFGTFKVAKYAFQISVPSRLQRVRRVKVAIQRPVRRSRFRPHAYPSSALRRA
jgi:nucleoid DNA-binding protein